MGMISLNLAMKKEPIDNIRDRSASWIAAFPEPHPLLVIQDRRRATDRLETLLTHDSGHTPQWIYWLPNGDHAPIRHIYRTGDTQLLIPPDEHGISRIAAYAGQSSAYAWIYIETEPIPTPGLTVRRDGEVIPACNTSQGAAPSPLRARLLKERRRHIVPYSFLILPIHSHLTAPLYTGPLSIVVQGILHGHRPIASLCDITTLIQAVDELPFSPVNHNKIVHRQDGPK
jgi:hypothetical protein